MTNDLHAEWVAYTGKVYGFCVPPHHLIRTRRNGKAQWTGNSGRDVGGYTCFDAQTEVLTRQGWFSWEAVTDTLEFATVTADGAFSYEKPNSLTAAPYEGPMFGYQGRYVDYLVTPNHRLWVQREKWRARDKDWDFLTAEELHGARFCIRQAGIGVLDECVQEMILPSSKEGEPPRAVSMDDFAELVGWWVAEGSVKFIANPCEYKTYIWQSRRAHPDNFERILELVRGLGFSTHTHRNVDGEDVGIVLGGKQLAAYLRNFGVCSHKKRIPRELLLAGDKPRRRLFDAMMAGDGCQYEDGHSNYTTVSQGLADDMQELCLRLGDSATIRPFSRITTKGPCAGFVCGINQRRPVALLRNWGERSRCRGFYVENYQGMVYCATVPSGRLIVRRNGKAMVSGNSEGQPSRGGKRGGKKMSGFDVSALLSHGATEVLKDSHLVRGTRNEDYWNALRLGRPLPEPTIPFIYDKFVNTLKAGGINVVKKGDIVSIMPLTDSDTEQLSSGEIQNSDQVESKNLEPLKGGLFDPTLTGGLNGDKFTHVTLAEPLPNPVMEEAIRRLLGLRVQDYLAVLSGRQSIDGLSGGKGIERALRKIDVPQRLEELKATVMNARGQKRDDAVKALRYLHGAQKQGINPGDWVITKVPILPPKFRPVSVVGDMIRAADMNGLYRDLIETNNGIKELRGQVAETDLADEKVQLYQAVQAAFGVGDPITPEGESKRWHGAIRQVIGSSPKFGMFNSKVLSKTVDVVGRGVITPDPNLDMDQLGIPEDKAWELYRPFILRRLVRRGFPPVKAAQLVEKRTKEAEDELQQEMEDRPVIMDRAPTWHKFNLLAFRPHVVKEDVLRVSPLITAGYNADFDGDAVNFHVPVTTKAAAEALEKMLPSKNLFRITDLKSVMHAPGKEMVMGLYQLTRDPAAKKPVAFKNARDAKKAYEQGLIGANDPIVIQNS